MIKESTDFLAKSFEKRNADLKMELLKDLDDALEKEMSSLKKQHLDSVFDTWNYLSEIKISLGEMQNSLDSQSNQSDVLKEKKTNTPPKTTITSKSVNSSSQSLPSKQPTQAKLESSSVTFNSGKNFFRGIVSFIAIYL